MRDVARRIEDNYMILRDPTGDVTTSVPAQMAVVVTLDFDSLVEAWLPKQCGGVEMVVAAEEAVTGDGGSAGESDFRVTGAHGNDFDPNARYCGLRETACLTSSEHSPNQLTKVDCWTRGW